MTTPPHIEKAARLAYNAAVGNKTDDGWWDKFTEGERDEWRRATLAVLSTTLEPGPEELLRATQARYEAWRQRMITEGLHYSSWEALPSEEMDGEISDERAGLVSAAKVRVGK